MFWKIPLLALKFTKIFYILFQTKSQFFFKVWITLHCNKRSFFCSFLAETSHAIDKSNISKWKFLDLQLLALKFTKFLISFFEAKVSFLVSHLNLYMLWTKRAQQSANFQTFNCSHENQPNFLCHFSSRESVFL